MTDEDRGAALLADVLAHPDDDSPRLVYADWLTQRGDPRGEFIAVQCALAAGTGDTSASIRRERELLHAHTDEWTEHVRRFARCDLRRGFIGTLTMDAGEFATLAGPFFDRDPIETLVVSTRRGPRGNTALDELANAPHLARLRCIMLRRELLTEADVLAIKRFLRSPHLETIRELELGIRFHGNAEPVIPILFEGVSLPALERFAYSVVALGLGPALHPTVNLSLRALATAKLPAIRRLSIDPHAEIAHLEAAFPDAKIRRWLH